LLLQGLITEETELEFNNLYTVPFENFVFKVPKVYSSTVYDDNLTIIDDNWFAMIKTESGNYDYFKTETDYLRTYMQASGYNVGEIQIKTYDGVEFLTAEVSQEGLSMVLAYAKLSSSEVAVIVVANEMYTIDASLLNYVAPIIKSATPATGTQGL
jgi:hypothetical protein